MTYASHYEKHLLYYLGLSFDLDRDYVIETDALLSDLIRYRGRSGALKTIKAVIALVSRRVIHGHPDRVEAHRQQAYLAWLRTVRQRLNDRATRAPKASPWPSAAVPAAPIVSNEGLIESAPD
jgi:recombinational DNA repair protein (RecF pathway)